MLHAGQSRQTHTASKARMLTLGCHQQSHHQLHQHSQPRDWGPDLKGAWVQAPCSVVIVAKALMIIN